MNIDKLYNLHPNLPQIVHKLKLGNYKNSERKHKKKNLYDLGSGDDLNTHHQKPINKKINNVDFIKLETSIL